MWGSPLAPPVEVVLNGSKGAVVDELELELPLPQSPHFHWMAKLLISLEISYIAILSGEFRRKQCRMNLTL